MVAEALQRTLSTAARTVDARRPALRGGRPSDWRHPVREVRRRRAVVAEMERLDPDRDCRRMSELIVGHLFGDAFFVDGLFTVAYWRQIAVRTIAPVLHQNGRGQTYETTKRVDDTLLWFGFLYRDGWAGDRAGASIDRLAAIHERFPIPPDDFRYTTASLCFEPVRILDLLGLGGALSAAEQRALFVFWTNVAERWGIDVPETQSEFRQWMERYEEETYARTDHGPAMAVAMADDYCRRFFPGPLRPFGYTLLRCLCDDRLLEAVDQPRPAAAVRRLVTLGVRAYLRSRRLVPASADGLLLAPWQKAYGSDPNPLIVGPDWARKVTPESRRHTKAGRCPMAAIKDVAAPGEPDGSGQPHSSARPDSSAQPDTSARPDGSVQSDRSAQPDGAPAADAQVG